ncbi:AGR378Cp [Eremothecium gossypii ATCC 10895]|uniref:AGR378Cp n=1 Tax=Eremothecium gossypii (strain ATCC 10895 / CBS 109.51 / FGSC 9923 / NRRL Y-1056) TaxID=284811 RepID=Q74Z28_EREGS|nr:AGR378Cp [Eremothecium gossypii ATCC 10895]AAS54868.1 AGR378Cp [Eremothecium gossypii ATCC 10895]AEY99200.1 FAGR378Cp [Eremothecium gossypii FDAG1]
MAGSEVARRPVQIAEFKTAVRELSQQELAAARQALEARARQLARTSERLARHVQELEQQEGEGGNLALFRTSLRENEVVLGNCRERLEAVGLEEEFRGYAGATAADGRPQKQARAHN